VVVVVKSVVDVTSGQTQQVQKFWVLHGTSLNFHGDVSMFRLLKPRWTQRSELDEGSPGYQFPWSSSSPLL